MIEIEEKKNPLFEGNIFWLYEALKNVDQDFSFDHPYTDKPEYYSKHFLFYECLMFNEDREDSLFLMQNGILFEYFSTNKYELILKLIQYYENRLKNNISKELTINSIPQKKSNPNDKILKKRFKFNNENHKDPESKFKSTIKANILIQYKDGTTHWIYSYELKKLLFYWKFLPRNNEIKIIRIFPLSVTSLLTVEYNYIDKDDEFVEGKEALIKKHEIKKENELLSNFVKLLKDLFYDKYLLNLKRMDIIAFNLDKRWYILDVKNFIFEKYENKHVKLDSENLFYRYIENYRDKTKMIKDPRKLTEIENFYKAMLGKYNEMFNHIVSKEYLDQPFKDPTSDMIYKMIKPNSPYKLSELMEPKTDLKTFVKYATYNLWNKENFKE